VGNIPALYSEDQEFRDQLSQPCSEDLRESPDIHSDILNIHSRWDEEPKSRSSLFARRERTPVLIAYGGGYELCGEKEFSCSSP
jgi:hypothetical protein